MKYSQHVDDRKYLNKAPSFVFNLKNSRQPHPKFWYKRKFVFKTISNYLNVKLMLI